MLDSFDRKISYLRISVTDRCNLRCTYCMPEEGVKLMSHDEILRFEEILEVVKSAVTYGVKKVRITGGEPLVRKGVTDLVRMISGIPEITDLSMTTNGILLEKFAGELREAGMNRINISLDTLDPQKFKSLSRGGDIEAVLAGIKAAQQVGLHPVKINCVIHTSSDEPDAQEVKEYCLKNNLEVRFIHQMDLRNGYFSVVEGGDGGHCARCNRLRLTANGMIKPCLFNDLEFSVRELGADEAIQRAIGKKPKEGTRNFSGHFYNIGG